MTRRQKAQSVDHVGMNRDTQTHSCGQRTDTSTANWKLTQREILRDLDKVD